MKAPRLLILASVTTTVFVAFIGTATANRGNDVGTVRLIDDCDPTTFNAALGEGACVGDGDTTFKEFGAALAEGGDQHWRNNPEADGGQAGARTAPGQPRWRVPHLHEGGQLRGRRGEHRAGHCPQARKGADGIQRHRLVNPGRRQRGNRPRRPRMTLPAQSLAVPQRTNAPRRVYSRCKQSR
jgi:hypothetical protein